MKAGGTTALALGLNLFSPDIFKRRLLAGGLTNKRLIFIFQRGGSDGVNTLIPYGDPQYNDTNRPTLFIPQAASIDLGNGFAGLHPSMQPMMEIYNHTSLNGVAGPGNLAVIHRVGYSGQSQSHFDSQQYWENGIPGQPYFEEGMFYRQVAETMDPLNNRFVAAGLSSGQMVGLKGPLPIPTLSDPANYRLEGTPAKVAKLMGRLPSAPFGPDGRGLLGAYGGARDAGKPYRELVYSTGLTLADSMSIVQDAVNMGPYTPENGAVYTGSLGQRLQQIAMLVKRTDVRLLGCNVGGWDTHVNQGQINGYHGSLLGMVAEGFQALYRDLQAYWEDTIVVTMTEFGRTSIENGSLGTDHAYACVVFVAGGGVNGGVYNCDSTTWAAGDLFSQSGRYVRRRTDFRAIFGEIFQRHFGDNLATLNRVIPGFDAARAANAADFTYLNFLPA